jgi:hypothetical protein
VVDLLVGKGRKKKLETSHFAGICHPEQTTAGWKRRIFAGIGYKHDDSEFLSESGVLKKY